VLILVIVHIVVCVYRLQSLHRKILHIRLMRFMALWEII